MKIYELNLKIINAERKIRQHQTFIDALKDQIAALKQEKRSICDHKHSDGSSALHEGMFADCCMRCGWDNY